MSETPNHGYNTPSKGTTDWHIALNENFDAIDAQVEIRDTEARKGEYEPKQGSKFFATDTGTVYLGDGQSWSPTGNSGSHHESAVYTSEYDGSLDEQFQAAADDIPAGTIVIPGAGRGHGNSVEYEWHDEVVVNPTHYRDGLSIHIQPGARVVYTGSGVPLTVRGNEGDPYTADVAAQIEGRTIKFVNDGKWIHEGNSAEGGLHFEDINFGYIDCGVLKGWTNSEGDCYGFRLSNWDRWSESNAITGRTVTVDRACVIDGYRDDATDNATTSLQDNYIHHFTAGQAEVRGFELRGDLSGASLVKCTAFNYGRGGVGYEFNGRCDGLTLISPECEEFTDASGNSTMFAEGPTGVHDHGPVILNACHGQVTNVTDGEVPLTQYHGRGMITRSDGDYYELTVENGEPAANRLDRNLE